MKPIKSLLSGLFIIGGLMASSNAVHAQLKQVLFQAVSTNVNWQAVSADDLEVMLEAVEQATPTAAEALPKNGTFYSVQNQNWPPLPGNMNNLPAWGLGNGIWLLADQDFDYAAQAQQNEALHAMARAMGLEMDNENTANAFVIDTNELWLEITNVLNGLAYLNLRHGTDYVYEVWSKQDLTVSNWDIETEVFPGTNQDVMPFTVSELGRTNLFIWARDWTGITSGGNETTEWWFWKYFHTVDLSDTNLDSLGYTLLSDYQNGYDPNVIQFSLQFTNTDLNTSTAYGSITILSGTPFYEAILINDTNEADADWQPYSSTNVIVSLNSGNGIYNVLVGLRGLPADAQQTWLGNQLRLNDVTPVLTITAPTAGTVSVPMIQLQGYVSASLSRLTYDVSNAAGVFTNQQGYWQPAFFDTNWLTFTTNSFQCYDIRLTNGLNQITLHATDVAGNAATANVSYTLDYSGDHTAPVLSFIWPTNGTSVAGSNFTLQAQVDDATATLTATINSNIVAGLVERNGTVWFNNLPLNSGANTVTITATDAAGNTSTTNLTVVESAVSLTVNPLTGDQLNQPSVTVSGTVSDPSDQVWVNGVQASVDGSGNWVANNVPVSPTGTASLNAQVTDSGGNSLAAQGTYQPQLTTVTMMGYSGHHDLDWGVYGTETINWTYQNGGKYVPTPDNAGDGFEITSNENGVAYTTFVDFRTGLPIPFIMPWENASLTIIMHYGPYPSTFGNYTQTRVMIQPGGQALAGDSLYLVYANACEFSSGQVAWAVGTYGIPYFDILAGVEEYWSYAGTVPLPPEWLQIKGQTLINSGITNADGSVSGMTLVSAPAGANADVTPIATQHYNYDDYTFNVRATNVTLEIVDANSGTDLTLQTNTVIVGQQMNLTCQLSVTNALLNNGLLTNFRWTVPGTTFSNFVADGQTGILNTNFSTTQSNVLFCWSDSGLKLLQISASVNGVKVTSQAWFNVLRPTATVTTQTASVNADNFIGLLGFYDAITYGAGITFSNAITIPSGFSGTNEWVQIVLNPYRAQHDTNGIWWVYTENGAAPYLDTSYPYTNRFGITANVAYDSPSSPLSNGYNEITATNSFKMWLMFKPAGGQWVPLRTVTWNWSGTATLSGSSWILASGSWSTNPPDADAGTIFPQWNSNVRNATYQAQP
jgi:hypothetical protein